MISPLLDVLALSLLLLAFHRYLFSRPRLCIVIALLALAKVFDICYSNHPVFWIAFNTTQFALLLVGLYVMRFSPNYFWLFSGLLAIKAIDVSLHVWLRQQGVWYLWWFVITDGVVLLLLDQRQQLVRWLAQQPWGALSDVARRANSMQQTSYQEIALMVVYWIHIILALLVLAEYGLNQWFSEPVSTLFYILGRYSKLPLNLLEIAVLLNIIGGYAICMVRRERVL